jgi:hypothetical protein
MCGKCARPVLCRAPDEVRAVVSHEAFNPDLAAKRPVAPCPGRIRQVGRRNVRLHGEVVLGGPVVAAAQVLCDRHGTEVRTLGVVQSDVVGFVVRNIDPPCEVHGAVPEKEPARRHCWVSGHRDGNRPE